MAIDRNSVVTGPHQPVNSECFDYTPELRDQIAVGESLLREAGGVSPFNRYVGILRVRNQATDSRLQGIGLSSRVYGHPYMVNDKPNAIKFLDVSLYRSMLAAGKYHDWHIILGCRG